MRIVNGMVLGRDLINTPPMIWDQPSCQLRPVTWQISMGPSLARWLAMICCATITL